MRLSIPAPYVRAQRSHYTPRPQINVSLMMALPRRHICPRHCALLQVTDGHSEARHAGCRRGGRRTSSGQKSIIGKREIDQEIWTENIKFPFSACVKACFIRAVEMSVNTFTEEFSASCFNNNVSTFFFFFFLWSTEFSSIIRWPLQEAGLH